MKTWLRILQEKYESIPHFWPTTFACLGISAGLMFPDLPSPARSWIIILLDWILPSRGELVLAGIIIVLSLKLFSKRCLGKQVGTLPDYLMNLRRFCLVRWACNFWEPAGSFMCACTFSLGVSLSAYVFHRTTFTSAIFLVFGLMMLGQSLLWQKAQDAVAFSPTRT